MKTVLLSLVLVFCTVSSVAAARPYGSTVNGIQPDGDSQYTSGMVVAQVYYRDRADLNSLARELDVWEVHPAENYLVAMLSMAQYAALSQAGYHLAIDPDKSSLLGKTNQFLPGQTNGIPKFPCYRTVEETYAAMDALVIRYPNLVSKVKVGESWKKINTGGAAGYDLFVIVLTNQSRPAADKGKYFVMGEIHAREYATAETAMRFAEYLLQNYGSDPDITWMLDYNEVHILPMSNPDGRKIAEQGYYQRKNVNNTNGGNCSNPPWGWSQFGTDLNRNASFHWGDAGIDPCEETYQGPVAASEPEMVAIQDYLIMIFPGQRDPANDTNPAPLDATGAFVTLHSYADVVLFPWGWSDTPSPNRTQLQTLGRKFGYFNNYDVCQTNSPCMYNATGTTDDWAYGALGVAAYTFEIGTAFFESCSTFGNDVLPGNQAALLYGVKAARRPYQAPAGPDTLAVSLASSRVTLGSHVKLTASADDTRYFGGVGGAESTYAIAGARYSIDQPSWVSGATIYMMTASDGNFDQKVEAIEAIIDTTGLSAGRHIIFVEAEIAPEQWGPPTAIFLDVAYSLYLPMVANP